MYMDEESTYQLGEIEEEKNRKLKRRKVKRKNEGMGMLLCLTSTLQPV